MPDTPLHALHAAGQSLWLEASPGEVVDTAEGADLVDACRAFGAHERAQTGAWRARIDAAATGGRVALWGAGAKGVTLANLVDPDCRRIDCVVDINPLKQGHFVPGTGHPIVGVGELRDRGVTSAVLTNANYEAEIRALATAHGLRLDLIAA